MILRHLSARAALEAEEEIKAGCADDRVYDCVLAATGDAGAAEEALRQRIAHRLRRGEKPAL